MRLSEHFLLSEFDSRTETVPKALQDNVFALAQRLQVIRSHLGKPIDITSGWRSPEHNLEIGGARRSMHLWASGADIQVEGMAPRELAQEIEFLMDEGLVPGGGIGVYSAHTHVDFRGHVTKWEG